MLPTQMSRRSRWSPRTLPEMRNEIDRLFENFFDGPAGDYGNFVPATDVIEEDDRFLINVELPGFNRDDVEVTMEQGTLTISGRRAAEREEEDDSFHLRERAFGRFSQSFSLPRSIDASNVEAHYDNGILRVEVPKAAEARSRKIEVDVS